MRTYTSAKRNDVPEGCIRLKLRYAVDGTNETKDGWFVIPLSEYRQLLTTR